jgi:hypothetical protein
MPSERAEDVGTAAAEAWRHEIPEPHCWIFEFSTEDSSLLVELGRAMFLSREKNERPQPGQYIIRRRIGELYQLTRSCYR